MARQNSQASRNGSRRQTPAWAMVLLGAAIGVVASVGVLFSGKIVTLRGGKNLPQPNPEAIAPKEPDKSLAEEAAKPAPAPPVPKNNYDFYSVLPEKEVVIPDAELSAKARAEQQRKQQAQNAPASGTASAPAAGAAPPAPSAGGSYMLQVTATSDAKAAEEMKAKLALLGYSAKVYANMPDGKIRVRLGPYASASEAESAKKTLAASNIPSFGVKSSH